MGIHYLFSGESLIVGFIFNYIFGKIIPPIAQGLGIEALPVYLLVATALKTPQELAESRLALPVGLHFENFIKAIEMTNFFNAIKNSLIITILSVSITIFINSMVAYAIARNMNKKFYKGLYFYFISAMFIPFPIIMLPIVKQTSASGYSFQLMDME